MENPESFLDQVERTKQIVASIIAQNLGAHVPASNWDKDMMYIMESIDELVYEPVRHAKQEIADAERRERLTHERQESTYTRAF